jgi:hypothetical protein
LLLQSSDQSLLLLDVVSQVCDLTTLIAALPDEERQGIADSGNRQAKCNDQHGERSRQPHGLLPSFG